jgi:hypothetical protein
MSQILWSDYLSPPKENAAIEFTSPLYGDSLRVPMTKAVPLVEREAALPDARVFRSMSRAAVLLSVVGLRAKNLLEQQLKEDAFVVGIYCAVENGPVDFESAKQIYSSGVTQENFAELYKKYRNPKMYLKQLPNLAAAQMGIFLGALGPMHIYNHSRFGSLSALEQAEADLQAGRVKLALVASAFSFENPIVVERAHRAAPGRVLAEGAGAILLGPSEAETNWENQDYGATDEYFGISQQIIELATRNKEA